MSSLFVPESVRAMREGLSRRTLANDVMAGAIVGIVALPLAIAFAIASGVKPEQGIYTAVVAGFIISCFGGSRVQIGGPTGAFIIVVFDIVARYGYDGLAVATIMAGFMLLVMGFSRLGAAIRFIPYPMTVGFTSGIALIIFTTQVPDFFGLNLGKIPGDFVGKLTVTADGMGGVHPQSLMLGAVTLAILIAWPRVTRKVPGSVVAILATTLLTALLGLDVATIGSRFGSVPSSLPAPAFPRVDLATLKQLISPAFTIAMLAAIESLLSAVVADGMTGRRHRSNMELVAQGIANSGVALFGGMPVTGTIARTATNVRAGAHTPVSGILHALYLLAFVLIAAPLAAYIPLAALAGLLAVVAWNMVEKAEIAHLLRENRAGAAVMAVTLALTLAHDLIAGIAAGCALAVGLAWVRRER